MVQQPRMSLLDEFAVWGMEVMVIEVGEGDDRFGICGMTVACSVAVAICSICMPLNTR